MTCGRATCVCCHDRDAMLANLTATQARGTELLNETRAQRAIIAELRASLRRCDPVFDRYHAEVRRMAWDEANAADGEPYRNSDKNIANPISDHDPVSAVLASAAPGESLSDEMREKRERGLRDVANRDFVPHAVVRATAVAAPEIDDEASPYCGAV